MRKSELLKLYENAYERISRLTIEAEEIKAENEQLKAKIAELESEMTAIKQADIATENSSEQEEIIVTEIEISSETQLGAQAIGRVVVSAAKHCNALATKGDSQEIKELINLILGRTEVAKAEILNIVSLNCELDVKKEMISREEASAEDYFISVRAQIA